MSPTGPEYKTKEKIDRPMETADWDCCDFGAHDISMPCAIREFPPKPGHGHAVYLLYLLQGPRNVR